MTESNPTEQRHFSRVPFLADARAQSGAETCPCLLLDIALKGALFEVARPENFPPETPCRLILPLGGQGGPQIVMEGEIAHREGNRIGMQCRHIDIDSMANLRRLVELNLGSDDFLERELHELLKPAS